MSPVKRQRLELEESKPSPESYITWLQALQNGQWTTIEDQHIVAQAIQPQMRVAKVWKETTRAKKPDKDKDFQRTRAVILKRGAGREGKTVGGVDGR